MHHLQMKKKITGTVTSSAIGSDYKLDYLNEETYEDEIQHRVTIGNACRHELLELERKRELRCVMLFLLSSK